MKKIIAIIPARSGSKRIKNKNIAELYGKPMIAWTIDAALNSGIFCDVLVSTDSREIADLSRSLGASVPFLRDPKDADDFTPVGIATANALIKMEEYKGIKYSTVVQLMPNCPCRDHEDIKNAYENFLSQRAIFQISVFKFGWMNPWWSLRLNKDDGSVIPLFPGALKQRSQDLEPLFCPTGAVWVANADLLKKEKTFYGKDYRIFPINWQSAIDIDDMDDFAMAEAILYFRDRQRRESSLKRKKK